MKSWVKSWEKPQPTERREKLNNNSQMVDTEEEEYGKQDGQMEDTEAENDGDYRFWNYYSEVHWQY